MPCKTPQGSDGCVAFLPRCPYLQYLYTQYLYLQCLYFLMEYHMPGSSAFTSRVTSRASGGLFRAHAHSTGYLRPRPSFECSCLNPATHSLHLRVMQRLCALNWQASAAEIASTHDAPATKALKPTAVKPQGRVLLTNLRLFDGISLTLRDDVQILIEDGKIIDLPPVGATVSEASMKLDCAGKVVIPGLIDAHWHSMFCGLGEMSALTADVGYIHLVAGQQARQTLLRGFTTVRDTGGPVFALKRAIDEGLFEGPRIFPSGAMISQTGGHGDFRMRYEVPFGSRNALSHAEEFGAAMIADGPDEVRKRVREQLMLGASQIKLIAGGGVTSLYDPLDSTQYSEKEMQVAVEAASDWGTYVMAHVYTPKGIMRAIRAGIQSIEHGQLADQACAKLMADEGIWWSLQPFFADEDANIKMDPAGKAAQQMIARGTEQAYQMARDLKIRTAWGTDILFTPQNVHTHGKQLAKLTRFYEPLEVLQMATAKNGELCQMSGNRSPYPGKLGVIEPGALADLLVIDSDPSKSLDFLLNPHDSLRVIMKHGAIHKNTLV